MKNLLLVLALLLTGCASSPRWLTNAHAHNDYLHARPLFDALYAGFCSVEADIWLVSDELLVAHAHEETRPGVTLQRLYLDPLREFMKHDRRPLTLMIDIKSDAETTYGKLREVLERYRPMIPNRFEVLITGNRPFKMIAAESDRIVAIDGTPHMLDTSSPVRLVPQISVKWDDEVGRTFQTIIARAHAQGRRIRFFATPDDPPTWRILLDAKVDFISTDHITELAAFLRADSRSRAAR